ncbi:nucleotidyltransferase [Fusobacterium sp.]|uniref:nucleotidyltransferase n=1 Tax=Fusobacterium sp. TaxID=68766 RepID=UPI0029037C91|nr:nucleotidyltransferase [Fusobacterium sp.]MDU1910802.1 nucleotidyltransferase [Fusobacterium sp.]
MRASGLVVEYNPFHNGHRYHFEKVCEIDKESVKIAVMSGDFVQRGEPAVVNRWKRAEMALKNGIDMVVELPVFYSCQSAEIFAIGSVGILNELKCNNIIFGSEKSDIEMLKRIAEMEETEEFKNIIKENLSNGDSYPTAHSKTLKIIEGDNIFLDSNDILGVEYIKAIKYWNSSIIPMLIKREKTGYYEENTDEGFASATAVRKFLKENTNISDLVPEESFKILKEERENNRLIYLKNFYPLLRYEIIRNRDILFNIQDMEKGYENRLYEMAIKNCEFKEFYNGIISKRFTQGRTQRILIHILTGITKNLTQKVKKEIPYVRVLGFNNKGREYLNFLKKEENNKIIVSMKNIKKKFSNDIKELIEFNERASLIYKMINHYEDSKIPLMIETR